MTIDHSPSFAIWITGLPASGKSTIVSALKPRLEGLGLVVEVLESDEVRRVITPAPTYSEAERDLFYRVLAFIGQKLPPYLGLCPAQSSLGNLTVKPSFST